MFNTNKLKFERKFLHSKVNCMKKIIIMGLVFIIASFSISAQGFYFDIGIGFGKAWTEINGYDLVDTLDSAGTNVDELAVDLGLKAGYGPLGNIPLYVVGEFAGIGHRIYDSSNYMQFNSYLIGPGVIFYPIPFIQLGLSLGYSYVANQTDIPLTTMYDGKGGFAWNVLAAVDLGGGNHGCLIGIKYFSANNTLKVSNADEESSMVSFFIKYAFRHKIRPNGV
jgi:hypothetical protein